MNVLREHLLYWDRVRNKMQGDRFFYNVPIVVEEIDNGVVTIRRTFDTASDAAVFLGCSGHHVARAACLSRPFESAPGKQIRVIVDEKHMKSLGLCLSGNLLTLDVQEEKNVGV